MGELQQRRVTQPDQTFATLDTRVDGRASFSGPDGNRYDARLTRADGTTTYALSKTHSAYGQAATFTSEQLTVLPSGLRRKEVGTQSTTIEPQSGRILTDQITQTVNGRSATTTYNAVTRTATTTSAAGRQSTRVLDSKGRLARSELPGEI